MEGVHRRRRHRLAAPGSDGRLWAINPEAGYFGVVPGTNAKTNRNAYETIRHNTLFTNVALTADNEPWWEGLHQGKPVIDWQGRPYDPQNGPAAHPNSRFTVSGQENPAYSPAADDPRGVPISALIFGGRRRELAPLVYQARNWAHGVLVGASVASETTAAATGQVGVVRRDPMAMKPFCGYHFGDYWAHWLKVGARLKRPPEVFHVNWFRQNAAGKFLWPGFGENLRVLDWILDRCAGRAGGARHGHWHITAPGGSEPGRAGYGAGGDSRNCWPCQRPRGSRKWRNSASIWTATARACLRSCMCSCRIQCAGCISRRRPWASRSPSSQTKRIVSGES